MVKSGDPVEQENQLKYASLVANAVLLSAMAKDGYAVTPALVACTSPHRRYGRFALDTDDLPNPLNPQPLPFETAL